MRQLNRFLAALLAASILVQPMAVTAQQYTAPTAAEAAASKAAGAEAAKLGQSAGVALNEDGSIQMGADGAPVQKTMTAEDKLKYFKGITGLSDVTQAANPGSGMVAGGSASLDAHVDIACAQRVGTMFMATGVEFQFGSCSMAQDGKVSAMAVKACTNQLAGDTCTDASDYFSLELQEGAYQTRDGVRYGLGCNATGVCRVQVKGTYSVQGTGEQLTAAAQQKRQGETANSYSSSLSKVQTSEEYTKHIQEDGTEMQACHQRSAQSIAAGGPPINCAGEAVTGILAGSSSDGSTSSACGTTAKCIREAVTTSKFARSCVRTFPLTVKSTSLQYGTKLECVVEDTTNSCDKPKGASDDWRDPRAGLTQVDSRIECATSDADGVCTRKKEILSYVDYRKEAVQTLRESASPSPVSKTNPTCDDSPLRTQKTCEGGNWFGRSLSDNECTVLYTNGGEQITEQLTWQEKPGCGVCMTPTFHTTCYGEPSEQDEADTCSTSDLRGCVPVSSPKAASFSEGDGTGLVISQEESYECTSESRVCVEREAASAECSAGNGVTVSTFGIEKTDSAEADSGTFGNAMAQAAVVDGISKGMQDSTDPNFPLIFSGEDLRCSRPTGGLGGLVSKNCCRTDLQRPKKGNIVQRGCDDNEVKLAAARRSSTTVYIGEYCSKKMRFPRKCLRITQTYCAFQGTLARVVQVQGRGQLADVAASGSGASLQRQALNFNYYSGGDTGTWTPATVVNGVHLSAYQYPSYCRSPELAAKKYATNPDAEDCPTSLDLWVAACDVPGGCGEMPHSPSEGAVRWGLQAVDPLKNVTTAVSRYSVVTGACDPVSEHCTYEVAAWPAGQGGKVTVSRDINFEVYSNVAVREGTSIMPTLGNVADLMYRTYSTPGAIQATLPATVRIDFSKDGGQTWTRVDVPTAMGTNEVSVPGSDIKVSGNCRIDANSCAFRMVGTTIVAQKPWGDAHTPDCTGFTPGQIGAMDFGRMDLSEWVNEVAAKASAQSETVSNKAAADAVKAQLSVYSNPSGAASTSSATLTSRRPEALAVAVATPGEGYGPFSVSLKASGRYPYKPEAPESGEQVTQVMVDWGDCSAPERMEFLSTLNGQKANGYVSSHRFEAPNADKHYTCGIGKENEVIHEVRLSFYTASGVKSVSLHVKNAWNSVSGSTAGNLAAVPEEKSVTVKK